MPKKIDLNQPAIVEALRAVGASVRSLAAIGSGCPDLVVGYRGKNWLVEVKNPEQRPSDRKLTGLEQAFFDTWRGQIAVIETVDEALKLIGAMNQAAGNQGIALIIAR